MDRSVFKSIFAKEMNSYLDKKMQDGCSEISFYYIFKTFDRFCIEQKMKAEAFSKEMADKWINRRDGEATNTQYSRVNTIRHFLIYLHHKGYPVYVTRDITFKHTAFKPHIYSADEIKRYFNAVDTFDSTKNKMDKLQYPLLFRLLYCCGTRITETLSIRKQDVDLSAGIVKLFEVKNNCERYIVLSDELLLMFRQYADKCFYLLNDNDYIFTSAVGGRCRGKTIHEHHRLFLKKSDIPYIGEGKGPRIHDWRHTFAVNSFKKMIDEGLDMYVALPILSTYLGHKTIYATEKYVRLTMEVYPFIEKQFKDKMNAVFGDDYYEAD